MHADVACRRGALADAEAESREALDMADEHALAWAEPVAIATLIESLGEQGRGDEADAVLAERELTRLAAGHRARGALPPRARAAAARAATGREEALEDFRRAGEVMERYGIDNPAMQGWRSGAAEALLRLGRTDEARALAEEELELARPFAARHAIGASLRIARARERATSGSLREAVGDARRLAVAAAARTRARRPRRALRRGRRARRVARAAARGARPRPPLRRRAARRPRRAGAVGQRRAPAAPARSRASRR